MKKFAIALVISVAVLGDARSVKADPIYTVNFTFGNTDGNISAYGSFSGYLAPNPFLTNPYAGYPDAFYIDSGNITLLVNNTANSPFLNAYSAPLVSESPILLFDSSLGFWGNPLDGLDCPICFEEFQNPADGGGWTWMNLVIESWLYPDIGGSGGVYSGFLYADIGSDDDMPDEVNGTFTLSGQVGNYDLTIGGMTPEPSTWLLIASGIVMIVFLLHRRSRLAQNVL